MPYQDSAIRQKLLNFINKPFVKKTITAMSNYNLTSPDNAVKHLLIGGALGGGGALLTSDKNKLRNTLLGTAAGAGLAHYGPREMQKLIGRVATNVKPPLHYNMNNLQQATKRRSVFEILGKLMRDEPLYHIDRTGGTASDVNTLAEVPYRLGFNLKPRAGAEHFRKVDTSKLSDRMQNIIERLKANKDKVYEFNPDTRAGSENITEIIASPTKVHGLLGNYAAPTPTSYYDYWDFGINPGEKLNESHLLRAFVNMFTDPVTIVGENQKPKQFSDIDWKDLRFTGR